MKILLIEDETHWVEKARDAVGGEAGWSLDHAPSGTEARRMAGEGGYDLLIVDRMIESDGSEGLALLGTLREMGITAPAIILSSLGHARHRVEGLDAGADDYLAKPFDAAELRARLASLARRAGLQSNPEVIVLGALEVRTKARTAHFAGRHIPLSPQEFNILAVLAQRHGETVSRDDLWREVWTDFPNLPPQVNVIDVAVARLRRSIRKIAGEDLVETVRLKGWCLPRAEAGEETAGSPPDAASDGG